MSTLIYMTKNKYPTLQSVLYLYTSRINQIAEVIKNDPSAGAALRGEITAVNIRYALTAVIMTPIMIVYPFFQKHFAKGIMLGAVKG